MAKHGKKYKDAAAKVNIAQLYSPQEAMTLARETSTTKFDSTVEMHIRTGLDPRQADQQVRDVVVLSSFEPDVLHVRGHALSFENGDGTEAPPPKAGCPTTHHRIT